MKNLKNKLFNSMIAFALMGAMLTLTNCNKSDDKDEDPCSVLVCQNGGEKIAGSDGCLCNCPAGYTGLHCETEVKECPVTVECPIGKTPNPDNGCACE